MEYAKSIKEHFDFFGFRSAIDSRNEKIGKKIREAQLQKIPYMVVVGDKDMENETISPRHRTEGDMGAMKLEDFIKLVKEEIDTKAIK